MYGPIFKDRALSTETYFLSVFWLSHPFAVYYLAHTGRGGIEMPTRVTYVITRAIRLCHPRFSLLFTPCSVSPPIELSPKVLSYSSALLVSTRFQFSVRNGWSV